MLLQNGKDLGGLVVQSFHIYDSFSIPNKGLEFQIYCLVHKISFFNLGIFGEGAKKKVMIGR